MEQPTSPDNDDLLSSLEQDFEELHRHFAEQLTQDVDDLKAEKSRLRREVQTLQQKYARLQTSYRALEANHAGTLSQQQQVQQQRWAKRLAQILAQKLREDLRASLDSLQPSLPPESHQVNYQTSYQLLSSLDETLGQTLRSLQQDLSSYQSSLAQQLIRMQTMEQQGAAILDSLVSRLSQQLQAQVQQAQALPRPELPPELRSSDSRSADAWGSGPRLPGETLPPRSERLPECPPASIPPPGPPPDLSQEPHPKRSRNLRKGLMLGAIATLILALHHVLVGAVGQGLPLLGLIQFTNVSRASPVLAMVLVWLETIVVLPLLLLLAPQLHGGLWGDLQQWLGTRDRRLWQLLGSGGAFLIAQVCLYYAIAAVGPAVAVPLLFLYPLMAIPLAWLLQGEKPTPLRLVVMLAVAMGGWLTAQPLLGGTDSQLGISAALLAAAAFGIYAVLLNLSFRRQCHPLSASIVQFGTVAILSSLLLLFQPLDQPLEQVIGAVSWLPLLLAGLCLGILTLLFQLFNFSSLHLVGGVRTALLAAATPLLTAILATLLTPIGPPQVIQWTGILLILIGGIALGLDRLNRKSDR